jgi:hypothetical protein
LYFKDPDSSNAIENEFLNETKLQLQIIERIRQYAKNEDQRVAVEGLLQVLIQYWWSKDLSETVASTCQEPVEQ